MSVQRRFDAIVVGAGHNGLTAAAYLAGAGLNTLVLERRETVGGCCVTEEVDPATAPGCRVSTASYLASMLRPEVIRDLDLGAHGLRMIPCDPAVQIALPDRSVVTRWASEQQTFDSLKKFSRRDAETFIRVDRELKVLGRYLEPFFMESPPDLRAGGFRRLREILRLWRRFRGIPGTEIEQLVTFLSGSLADFLDRNFESDVVKRLILANSTYGRHGGPYQPGSAMGLLFHLLSGGAENKPGFSGHVIGGMGSITQAMASACRKAGVEILTSSPVQRIRQRNGRVQGVALESGAEFEADIVVSNADPRRTFLGLLDEGDLEPEFRDAIRHIRMAGPSAKVNLVLDQEPAVLGMPAGHAASQRSFFTLVPTLEDAEHCYNTARRGDIPEDLWVDCVLPSNVDETLAPPGLHVLTCFVQFVPYRLRHGTWDEYRDRLGDQVIRKIAEYAPNVPGAVVARRVLTPLDLERVFGLTEGNIFHGDLSIDQMFFMRPLPGWSQYATPIHGLYLCGAGAHPGGGVTGAPGHNAARRILTDKRKGTT